MARRQERRAERLRQEALQLRSDEAEARRLADLAAEGSTARQALERTAARRAEQAEQRERLADAASSGRSEVGVDPVRLRDTLP